MGVGGEKGCQYFIYLEMRKGQKSKIECEEEVAAEVKELLTASEVPAAGGLCNAPTITFAAENCPVQRA